MSSMQYSQIEQLVPHSTSGQISRIVIGICDYIPCSLKFTTSLKIAIEGDYHSIINSVLWSQFFSKTLLKECQHHLLLQSYTSEGENASNPLFVKNSGNLYKLEDCFDWNCQLRRTLLKSKSKKGEIDIQGFNQNGKIKGISIVFGYYSQTHSVDLILKLCPVHIETHKIKLSEKEAIAAKRKTQGKSSSDNYSKKNNFQSTLGDKSTKTLLAAHNSNISHSKTSLKYQSGLSQSKKLKESISKSKTKQVRQSNKENKERISELEKPSQNKRSKIINNKIDFNPYDPETVRTFQQADIIIPKISTIYPQHFKGRQSLNGRESVLSKMLTAKEEIIIVLKEQLSHQENQYEQLIQQQKRSHQEQAKILSQNLKDVLEEYENSKRQLANENSYLKQRLKVMEQAVMKHEAEADKHLSDKESSLRITRELQNTIKQTNTSHNAIKKQLERDVETLKEENQHRLCQIQKWMQKCSNYQAKYETIVAAMRQTLPKDQ